MDKKTSNRIFAVGLVGVITFFFPWVKAIGTSYWAALKYVSQSGYQIFVTTVTLKYRVLIIVPPIMMLANICTGLGIIPFKRKILLGANLIGCTSGILYVVLIQSITDAYQINFGYGAILYAVCAVLEILLVISAKG